MKISHKGRKKNTLQSGKVIEMCKGNICVKCSSFEQNCKSRGALSTHIQLKTEEVLTREVAVVW